MKCNRKRGTLNPGFLREIKSFHRIHRFLIIVITAEDVHVLASDVLVPWHLHKKNFLSASCFSTKKNESWTVPSSGRKIFHVSNKAGEVKKSRRVGNSCVGNGSLNIERKCASMIWLVTYFSATVLYFNAFAISPSTL